MPRDKYVWGWLKLPANYRKSFLIGEEFFRAIFQYENALRLTIHNYLKELYGAEWWEIKLKNELQVVYEYARERELERKRKPVLGSSDSIEVLPIHNITLGHLNEIVIAFKSDCIPELFPNIKYYERQARLIKKFRDLCFHFFPGINDEDWSSVKKPINELSKHLEYRLR